MVGQKAKVIWVQKAGNGLLKDESAGDLRSVKVDEKNGWLIAVFFVRFIGLGEVRH
ncbi:MAG: hypothetical protein JST42_23300 [Bacteroidetes bacterium]|nr:hypothetical protein [Bacteroidota bacterium]